MERLHKSTKTSLQLCSQCFHAWAMAMHDIPMHINLDHQFQFINKVV